MDKAHNPRLVVITGASIALTHLLWISSVQFSAASVFRASVAGSTNAKELE